MSEVHKTDSGLSRRAFLKGSSLTAATALVGSAPSLAQDSGAAKPTVPAFGPGSVRCVLDVNGSKLESQIEPRVTLLDALRNYVDVTGPKRVCDRGTCGACTVLIEGKPIYSCMTLALEAQGRKIETAENLLGGNGGLHRVPATFAATDAQQCGFCTPGFVMAMKAVLDRNPSASPAEIEHGLCGNICRCGTYQQMRDAVATLCKK